MVDSDPVKLVENPFCFLNRLPLYGGGSDNSLVRMNSLVWMNSLVRMNSLYSFVLSW